MVWGGDPRRLDRANWRGVDRADRFWLDRRDRAHGQFWIGWGRRQHGKHGANWRRGHWADRACELGDGPHRSLGWTDGRDRPHRGELHGRDRPDRRGWDQRNGGKRREHRKHRPDGRSRFGWRWGHGRG